MKMKIETKEKTKTLKLNYAQVCFLFDILTENCWDDHIIIYNHDRVEVDNELSSIDKFDFSILTNKLQNAMHLFEQDDSPLKAMIIKQNKAIKGFESVNDTLRNELAEKICENEMLTNELKDMCVASADPRFKDDN